MKESWKYFSQDNGFPHKDLNTLSYDHFCNLACSTFPLLPRCHPLLTSSTKTPHTFPPNSSNSPSFVASSFTLPYVNACTSCNGTKRLLNYTVQWKVQITKILCHFLRSLSWKFNTCDKSKYAHHYGHMLECYPLQHVFSSVPTENKVLFRCHTNAITQLIQPHTHTV